ncbi:MAG: hypothetical protein NHB32_15195 [Fischerella sp. CENA71]|nr:hypothetical protein [Fischerella sp. CENA71]
MLTTDQLDRLEICRDWLIELAVSDEYLRFPNTGKLQYAIRHIEAVLSENQPCDYIPQPKPKRPSIKNRLRSLVLEASVHTLKASFIGIVLCGLGTVFCYGLDRVQQSRGEDYQPIWSNQAKVFSGLAICSISVAIGAGVVGVCASGGEQDE